MPTPATTTLITPSEISSLAREVFIDDSKATRFIVEAEEMDVRPVLGDKMLAYIRDNVAQVSNLLNGTTYTYNGQTYTFSGLKKAVAYYTYARLIVGGDIEVTRSGVNILPATMQYASIKRRWKVSLRNMLRKMSMRKFLPVL